MKIGIIGQEFGIHEKRFLTAFEKRGVDTVFYKFDELMNASKSQHIDQSLDLIFGGPLHQGLRLPRSLDKIPFIAVSYAVDILYEAERDHNAADNVRELLGLCAGLLVDCEAVLECAKNNFNFDGTALVRPWGLDKYIRNTFEQNRYDWLKQHPSKWVVSTRNFTHIHGIKDVIRGFAYAASRIPDLNLCMLGDGPLRKEIEELINALKISGRVKIIGKVPEADLERILKIGDIYVSATQVDGTSISLLQALDAGITVLISNVGGNSEWVDRVNGAYMFNPGDWEQLGRLIVSHANKKNIPRYQRTEVIKKYADWNKNADDIMSFCESVIRKSRY